ncbi:MAG: hypothetical protein LIO78_08360 [Clostridiales bacterium]|nr:hypothetical protein [Clostridiales bacterium]MCC8074626.1 hypothetical protein [Clostridiales bacterium]MCC8100055.1 hypothetical protein [Clostridiales bacterium]
MTIQEMSQLYWLNREIELDKQRLAELKSKAEAPHSPSLTGLPGGGDNSSALEWVAAEIVDLQAIIDAKHLQCIHERNRLERYIADIDDSLTRMIFRLRFVNGLSWQQVATSVGGGNTADGMRKRVKRYLEQEK